MYMRNMKSTSYFDSVREKNEKHSTFRQCTRERQKLHKVSIVNIRKTKTNSRFNSVHEKKKNYFTFR